MRTSTIARMHAKKTTALLRVLSDGQYLREEVMVSDITCPLLKAGARRQEPIPRIGFSNYWPAGRTPPCRGNKRRPDASAGPPRWSRLKLRRKIRLDRSVERGPAGEDLGPDAGDGRDGGDD